MAAPRTSWILGSGSQLLRDVGVLALLALASAPLWLLLPRVTVAALGAWFLLFLTPLPRWLLGRAATPREPCDRSAVVVAVLAGGFDKDGALSARSQRRLRHGVALAQRLQAPLHLCGGARHGARSEAQALAEAARALGFTGTLVTEDRSRTTLENLLALRDIQEHQALLVTCPQHRPRLRRLCEALLLRQQVHSYPVAWLPRGLTGALRLGVECLYECAVHLYLSLHLCAAACHLAPPLHQVRRGHLQRHPEPEQETQRAE